jgi:hypothetical protein
LHDLTVEFIDVQMLNVVSVDLCFFFGTKRKTDLDNFNKLWQDALSVIVYEDDSQISELHLFPCVRQRSAANRDIGWGIEWRMRSKNRRFIAFEMTTGECGKPVSA